MKKIILSFIIGITLYSVVFANTYIHYIQLTHATTTITSSI